MAQLRVQGNFYRTQAAGKFWSDDTGMQTFKILSEYMPDLNIHEVPIGTREEGSIA